MNAHAPRPAADFLRRITVAALAAVSLGLPGCTRGPGYPTATVRGAVRIDGHPVPKGSITFSPLDQGPVTGAPIIDGQYCCQQVPAGRHKVTLQAQAAEPNKVYDVANKAYREVPKDILPEKYRSGVDVEVKPGQATQDFNL